MTFPTLAELQATLPKSRAYILPNRDAFLEPYPFGDTRNPLALVGFTGSSGLLVVTPTESHLFTDSRYRLQGMQETSPYGTQVWINISVFSWLKEQFKGVLIANPWHFSCDDAARLEAVLENSPEGSPSASGRLRWHTDLWHFPHPPQTPPPSFGRQDYPQRALDESLEKMPLLGKSFQEKCADIFQNTPQARAVLLCQGSDIAWTLDRRSRRPFTPRLQAYLLLTKEGDFFQAHIFTSQLNWGTQEETYYFHPLDALVPMMNQLGCIAYAPVDTPVVFLQTTHKPQWTPLTADVCRLRLRKTPEELSHIRNAHILDGCALTRFLYWLDQEADLSQETEYSAAQKLESFRREYPAYQGPSFPTISASGPASAVIHYVPSAHQSGPLAPTIYLNDSGGQYHYGTTDVTRTVWLGSEPACPHTKKIFTAVLKGHIQVCATPFPTGTPASSLDAMARLFLWEEMENYAHSTGHGVGCYLDVHEPPLRISTGSQQILEESMVFSNEPGCYLDHQFGVRLENLVTITALRPGWYQAIPLTLAPFDRKLMMQESLSTNQRQWLNAYHQTVFETLSPLLPDAVSQWLSHQTSPLM